MAKPSFPCVTAIIPLTLRLETFEASPCVSVHVSHMSPVIKAREPRLRKEKTLGLRSYCEPMANPELPPRTSDSELT